MQNQEEVLEFGVAISASYDLIVAQGSLLEAWLVPTPRLSSFGKAAVCNTSNGSDWVQKDSLAMVF